MAEITKLHITQDDRGYWLMSFEDEDGRLSRITSLHEDRLHLVNDALEMVEKKIYPGATVVIEAGRPRPSNRAETFGMLESPHRQRRPPPRRALL